MMPVKNPSPAQAQGFDQPEMLSIDARRWQAMRRQMIRLVLGWRYAEKEIGRILDACRHTEGCPAAKDRAVPCLASCPDRETFLSALVIHANATAYSMLQRDLPLRFVEGEYKPPSREFFDTVVSQLEVFLGTKDILTELQQEIEKGATASPWVTPDQTQPVEKPLTRLKPPSPEDEEDEDPTSDTNPGIDINLQDSSPPEDGGA